MTDYREKEFIKPKWDIIDRVHCWRNYASKELKDLWWTFDNEQRVAIARSMQDVADSEEWD
jgi:hypothetical protein